MLKRVVITIVLLVLVGGALSLIQAPGTDQRPKEPPVTVHDGSLKVQFWNEPTTSSAGLYTVGFLYLTPIYISSDFIPSDAATVLCKNGDTNCPGLQLPWKIVVCDLNLGRTPGPDNQLGCQHGVVTCSPGNPDSACRPMGVDASSSAANITVFSMENELQYVSDKLYQNIDKEDADTAKCHDNDGHRCDFPGDLVITQGSGKAAHRDTYTCTPAPKADPEQICRVEIAELQPKQNLLTYLVAKVYPGFSNRVTSQDKK